MAMDRGRHPCRNSHLWSLYFKALCLIAATVGFERLIDQVMEIGTVLTVLGQQVLSPGHRRQAENVVSA
ncbi:hypothetical protein [Mesorhizobium sp. LNHC209A00]|uniref:hypothetical protein n=1 Tax=Mesorhizobium sp. LNHC209A00 TaxID=1287226 RepID=UPI001FD9C454|nr:hypothetical protein [Mesorhizobium sp. LNHC209A00]